MSNERQDLKNGILSRILNYIWWKKEEENDPKLPNYTKLNNLEENNKMWVPDDKAKICHNCQKEFNSIFIRKHHCRICGNIFCYDCSNKNIEESTGK